MSRRKKSRIPISCTAHIEGLTHEGRGVARIEGKTVFVDGALPGEEVEFVYTHTHRKHDEGNVTRVLKASTLRVQPQCIHFDICGGCSLQHLEATAQIETKQKVLLDDLQRIGKVTPLQVRAPLTGPHWGYRRKARLGVKYVKAKDRVLVGFRERGKPYLADLTCCEVLHPSVGARLTELAALVQSLSVYDRVPQIEVAVGDLQTALVFRHMAALTDADCETLTDYARSANFIIYLQAEGPDSVVPLWPESPPSLSYSLPRYGIEVLFLPNDFTQVNQSINLDMVDSALELLQPQKTDRVLELFCGLGNFSLALAQQVQEVIAVEGESSLVQRARENAARNGRDNIHFHVANLAEDNQEMVWLRKQRYDKILLDPPRSGAEEIIRLLKHTGAKRIVYVSCSPATLARDAGILVNELGYTLETAGVMDMFPHTAHVESIALFTRKK